MKFKPFNGKVIIKKIEAEKTLIIMKNDVSQAEIISISDSLITGNGLIKLDMFQVGDIVMIPFNAGSELKIEGETVHMIQISDILGKY